MPTHPIYGNFLATFTPMVGVSIGLPNPISGGLNDPAGMISSYNPHFFVDASSSMLGALEAPILDVDPSNASSLDIITASRTGTATYTDLSGTIQLADPHTVRVDHVQGEELTPTKFQNVLKTDFDTGYWTELANVTAGSGLSGKESVIVTAVNNSDSMRHAITTTDGVEYTGSFYIRRVSGVGSVEMIFFNSATVDPSPVITVTNEWMRVEETFLGRATGGTVTFGVRLGTAGDAVEIAMPQVEEGTTVSDFVENTTGSPKHIAAATYAPRVPMILVEPAATNLIANSNTFSTQGTAVIDGTDYLAPDGTNTATQVSNILDAAGDRVYSSASVVGDTEYSGSIFVKGTAGEKISFYTKRNNGTYAGSPYTQVVLTGEWQRVTNLTFTTASDNTSAALKLGNVTNATADVVQIWGGQFEEGSISTSYIPTAGSTVTRDSDDLVIDGSDFTNFFNTDEGTFYIEMELHKDSDGTQNWILGGGSTTANFLYQHGDSNRLLSYDGTNILNVDPHPTNQIFRAAMTYNATTQSSVLDGGTIDTDTHNGNYSTADQLRLGSRSSTGSFINGRIKRVLYWSLHSDNL